MHSKYTAPMAQPLRLSVALGPVARRERGAESDLDPNPRFAQLLSEFVVVMFLRS